MLPAAEHPPETIAVIDFEIAAVLVRDGQIVGHYASLLQSGAWVPPFIERLTGIGNAMLARAPPAERVMREVAALHRLPSAGRAHRALADAQVTAKLLLHMHCDVMRRYALPVAPHGLPVRMQRAARGGLAACVAAHRARGAAATTA